MCPKTEGAGVNVNANVPVTSFAFLIFKKRTAVYVFKCNFYHI